MADLFAPIMAPYRALQQQNDDYHRALENLADRRYMANKSELSDSFKKAFEQKLKRAFTVCILLLAGQYRHNHCLLNRID